MKTTPETFISYLEKLRKKKLITYESKQTVFKQATETESEWSELWFKVTSVVKSGNEANSVENTIKIFSEKEFKWFVKALTNGLGLKFKAKRNEKAK